MLSKKTIVNLPNNNRFYILVGSVLVSIFVTCWLRLQVSDDTLYYVQLEQAFGFLSIAFLYVALIISPIKKLIGASEWMKNVVFARRAIGVSAAYFALLHTGVSLWGTMGGLAGLSLLPVGFLWPMIWGAIAVVLLCVLAFLSVDKMVVFLGYPRWKWLQRWVYLSGVLIVVHMWLIGVHFGAGPIQTIVALALIVLFGLEAWRAADFLTERHNWSGFHRRLLFVMLWGIGVAFLGLTTLSRPAEAHMMLKDTIGGSGAVLHVSPDDDPIAGERASFVFDIQAMQNAHQVNVTLAIADDQYVVNKIPGRLQGNKTMAEYIFPRQGLYTLTLTISRGDAKIHQFSQSLRVSRGVIIGTTTPSQPMWAQVGLWCTAIVASGVVTLAIRRRKAIGEYSKL